MWRGIRARTTALAAVVAAAVLIVTGIALVSSQRRQLTEDLDDSLVVHSDELAASVESHELNAPLAGQGDDDAIAQIVTAQGDVFATANFASHPALPAPPRDDDRQFRTARLIEGEPKYRILSRRVDDVVVHTATPVDDIEESLAALRTSLAIAIPVAAAALALLVWWLVGRTLRPVEAIRREVAEISGGSLHRRVPEPATGDEIARLAHTMNAMLDRVEDANNRQRRFVADASHELRSPLTRIRSEIEVDLEHPDVAQLEATHHSVLEETGNLQRLVEDLLVLARSDSGRPERPHVPVDLDDIVLREARRIRESGTSPAVDTSGVSAAQVLGDPDELTRAVRNLTENAAQHARDRIVITLAERGDRATLTVADDGPGIAPDDRERVFERFARLDAARAATDGGSGLGLAIAREIVDRHHGTIVIEAGHTPGTRFAVDLPRWTGG